MTIKILKSKTLELKQKDIIAFYKADITNFGNGAKIDCKKEFLDKRLKAYVVVCHE